MEWGSIVEDDPYGRLFLLQPFTSCLKARFSGKWARQTFGRASCPVKRLLVYYFGDGVAFYLYVGGFQDFHVKCVLIASFCIILLSLLKVYWFLQYDFGASSCSLTEMCVDSLQSSEHVLKCSAIATHSCSRQTQGRPAFEVVEVTCTLCSPLSH